MPGGGRVAVAADEPRTTCHRLASSIPRGRHLLLQLQDSVLCVNAQQCGFIIHDQKPVRCQMPGLLCQPPQPRILAMVGQTLDGRAVIEPSLPMAIKPCRVRGEPAEKEADAHLQL